jgi:hypothetical protein
MNVPWNVALGAALGVAALGMAAQVHAFPSGPGSARDVINSLERRGYRVEVIARDPISSLDEARVVAVVRDPAHDRVDVTVQ